MFDLIDAATATPAALGGASIALGPDSSGRDLLILPFTLTPSPRILMVWRDGVWGLPRAAKRRGVCSHASAAIEAQKEAGVAGRVFKRSIVLTIGERRVRAYPFLVGEILPAPGVRRGWATAGSAATVMGADAAPLADFLGKLRLQSTAARRHRR